MRRITTPAIACAAACLAFAATAFATPLPNSAVVHTRVFNDCPVSILTVNNLFPGIISIDDQNVVPPFCAGFANLHTWRFSTNGVDPIGFLNGDTFEYSATMILNGVGEGGLSLSPWWSPDPDGLFNVRTTDGEIACFGGRLPFFSFTGAFGLHYANNTPIQLGISYIPNGLSSVSPAAVVYNVRYLGTNYTSGLLNFDEGNVAEGAVHGNWGALTTWQAGGHMKMFVQLLNQPHGILGTWSDIQYTSGPTPTTKSSWGQIKKLYR
jgi:hypothetical protein